MVSLNQIPAAVLTIVLIGMVLALGALFLTQADDTVTDIAGEDSVAQNATEAALEGVGDFADWIPIIVITIIMVVIIGLLGLLRFTGRI